MVTRSFSLSTLSTSLRPLTSCLTPPSLPLPPPLSFPVPSSTTMLSSKSSSLPLPSDPCPPPLASPSLSPNSLPPSLTVVFGGLPSLQMRLKGCSSTMPVRTHSRFTLLVPMDGTLLPSRRLSVLTVSPSRAGPIWICSPIPLPSTLSSLCDVTDQRKSWNAVLSNSDADNFSSVNYDLPVETHIIKAPKQYHVLP